MKLSPHSQKVFSAKDLNHLRDLHTALSKCTNHTPLPILFDVKAVLATEVLGAVSTRAFWPGHGKLLSDISYDKLKVGMIQYFFSHKISLKCRDGEAHRIKE